jgi:phenylpropionate dioxygenase-like ring-hydroxylating dioxygenase large terminal subunit
LYLHNAWYVAGWSNEITAKPIARTFLDEPVVLYRAENGSLGALEDRCCHRGMPLSHGEVIGNDIRCDYHGMVFDKTGRCVDIPNQKLIPAKAKVRSFPIEEKDDLVWIWMGDPEQAKPEEIVAYPFHKSWPYKCKSERLPCNYLMVSDNLLDQTHAAYVHKSTLASDADAYARAEMEIAPTPDGVKFTRWMLNCIPPGIYSKAVSFKGRVDRWQEFEYVAPSCILQFTGALDVGLHRDPDPQAVRQRAHAREHRQAGGQPEEPRIAVAAAGDQDQHRSRAIPSHHAAAADQVRRQELGALR